MSNERGFPRARDLDRLWRHVADLMPVSPIVDTWAPRFMSYGTFTASKINGMMLRPSVTLFIAPAALSSHNCILSLMNCRLSWVGRQSQLFSVPVQLEITLYCWQPTDGVVLCVSVIRVCSHGLMQLPMSVYQLNYRLTTRQVLCLLVLVEVFVVPRLELILN